MTQLSELWPEFEFRVECDVCGKELARGEREELAIDRPSYFKKLIQQISSNHAEATGHYSTTVDVGVTRTDVLKEIDTTITVNQKT